MDLLCNNSVIRDLTINFKPDDYICHVYESSEEAHKLSAGILESCVNHGDKFIYLSDASRCTLFRDYLGSLNVNPTLLENDGLLLIKDIRINNLFSDSKAFLNCHTCSQKIHNTETYLIIDINNTEEKMLTMHSLLENLAALNGYLLSNFSIGLLAQFDNRNFTPIKQQMLFSLYPIHILNKEIHYNRLYQKPSQKEPDEINNTVKDSNLQIIDLPIYESNERGEIISCNSVFNVFTGYTNDELLYRNVSDVVSGRRDLFPAVNSHQLETLDSPLSIYHFQTEYRKKDGSFIITDEIMCSLLIKEANYVNYHILRYYDGEPDTYYMLLHHNAHQYQRIFNTSNGAMILLDPLTDREGKIYDARIMEISQSCENIMNISSQRLSEQTVSDMSCINLHLWLEGIEVVLGTGRQVYFEAYEPIIEKYLDIIIFAPIAGKLAAVIVDVTQVKKIEERFQEQIIFLENILDGIPTPAFYRDTCGNFQFANKAFEIALGLARKDILGKSLFRVLPEDLASKYREMDLDLLSNAGIQTYEWEFQNADGDRHDVIFNKAPLSNSDQEFIGVVGTFIDITQRKIAQEALRISEEKFRSVFHQSPIGIAVYNPRGQLLDVNMAMTDILGIEGIDDVKHFNLFADKHFRPTDEDTLANLAILSYEEELNFDKIRTSKTFRTLKTGKSLIRYYISPLRYPDGSIEGFLVQIQDITEQKKAAEALRDSEANLRRLTDNMIDMIGQVNIGGDYEYITPSCYSMLGYETEEMLGRSFYEFIHPQDLENVREHFISAFRAKTFSKFDYRYRCKDDSYLYMETVVNVIYDCKGRIYGAVLVSRDISDRKRMEGELSRLDRLKTVGEMAAGLGHEIRNPMTTVRGFLQMLGGNLEFKDYKEVFDLMIEELDDANSIITEFLSLAKDKPLYSEKENLNDILMAIYPLISADAIKSDKQVKMDLKTIPDLMLDSKEIRQLIFNMTRNGLESMAAGEVLTIRTYQDDNTVVLQIQDQGCGIQEEILDNLGTPFYTTKDMGIGLGLPICFNIASRHNASIDVDTSSEGTTFWVKFKL
ncbi:signal transduction histidine kinase, nitrogen specific, ntrb [hydrocarbon metagenome]|uniref:histidine kinase n=1 Tax=hydrocarbon metagenome TaxID=938273 RepID=A0A0W8E969_9ZZZZ